VLTDTDCVKLLMLVRLVPFEVTVVVELTKLCFVGSFVEFAVTFTRNVPAEIFVTLSVKL